MADTDEEAVAAEDDALYVLTAVLLTPAKFPSVLGDDYPEACAALGLAPLADGYGLVLGQDGDGSRWTVVIDDVSLVAVAIASWDCGMEYDLSPSERTVVAALPGWPLAVAVAAPNVPAPHDPDPDLVDRPPLAPRTPPPGVRRNDAWAPTRSHSSGPPGGSRSTTRPSRRRTGRETRRRRTRPRRPKPPRTRPRTPLPRPTSRRRRTGRSQRTSRRMRPGRGRRTSPGRQTGRLSRKRRRRPTPERTAAPRKALSRATAGSAGC